MLDHPGRKATAAGYEERLGGTSMADLSGRRGALGPQPPTGAEPGEAAGQPAQRHGPGRYRAAVGCGSLRVQHGAGKALERRPHLTLYRMLRIVVVMRVDPQAAPQAQIPCMLTRTIIVEG